VEQFQRTDPVGIIDADHPAGFDMEAGFFPGFALGRL
jgi:hypothetical protein